MVVTILICRAREVPNGAVMLWGLVLFFNNACHTPCFRQHHCDCTQEYRCIIISHDFMQQKCAGYKYVSNVSRLTWKRSRQVNCRPFSECIRNRCFSGRRVSHEDQTTKIIDCSLGSKINIDAMSLLHCHWNLTFAAWFAVFFLTGISNPEMFDEKTNIFIKCHKHFRQKLWLCEARWENFESGFVSVITQRFL